jgi:hypothetical protein
MHYSKSNMPEQGPVSASLHMLSPPNTLKSKKVDHSNDRGYYIMISLFIIACILCLLWALRDPCPPCNCASSSSSSPESKPKTDNSAPDPAPNPNAAL